MKSHCLFLFAVLLVQLVSAQEKFEVDQHHFARGTGNAGETLSTGNSGTGANIDVVYHRANWTVDPNAGSFITGTITTYFKTIQPAVSNISFDLVKSSFQQSIVVTYHGIACNVIFPSTGNVNILNIILPSTIAASNTLDSVTISYSGTPIIDGLGGGFVRESYTDQFGQAQNYITTLSESYEDKNWWPCKADMQDKIDSMDINVTVPWVNADTFWVASNGILTDSVISNGKRTFAYKTRYPTASYLVFFSAAKYNRYYGRVQTGELSTPSYFYLLAGKQSSYYSNALDAMRKMDAVVQAFGEKLGEYPFLREKHGYYDGLVGASGMEHQTFSGIMSSALTSLVTLDHELMHQWFGDNVTFGTWNDLWLAEGFARYGELLAAELVPALGYDPYIRRVNRKNAALSLNNTSLWIPDASIANSSTIWNSNYGSAVYERGCMVVSMLRTICGDEKFFNALRNYQTALQGKSASTDSLKRFFNEQLQNDISEFFLDYVGGSGNASIAAGGRGNPAYEIKWNSPEQNKLMLGVLSQSPTGSSNVEYFNGPVVVRAIGSNTGEDTTIVFYDNGNGNLNRAGNGMEAAISGNALAYDLSFTPVAMFYDDSARTLSTGSMIQDVSFEGYVWYGTIDSNWNNDANWAACCGVPPAGADVTIATVNHAPVLSSAVALHDINFKDGKFISIAGNTVSIDGAIKGNGTFKGSSSSNIILSGKAGVIHFSQASAAERQLQSLVVQEGASVIIASDAEISSLFINPTATVTVAPAVKLITH